MSEEEKIAVELLEDIKNNSWTTKYIMSSDSKNAELLLNLIEKLRERLKLMEDYNYWVQLATNRGLELEKLQKENKELDNDNTEWRAKYVIQLAKIDDLQKENKTITQQRDYYKARYNEFNEAFIKMKS